jgi:hypothetical protein
MNNSNNPHRLEQAEEMGDPNVREYPYHQYPSPPEEPPFNLQNFSIGIRPLDYGYVLDIGCKSFAFESREKMMANLNAYLADPARAQKQWNETKNILM